jgi:16S rRNA (guanine527-N7)-methyltransferase
MPGTEDAVAELRALSARWRVGCDAIQTTALLGYAELLIRWNQRINLTGARSVAAVVTEHYPDAFALARRLDRPARLVDVGSGGGLPAIPLALLRPELTIRLCEPIAKKGAFLRTAIRELQLAERVSLGSGRGEDLADKAPGSFDGATSRATFEPGAWLALGRRLVRPGGRVFVLTVPGSSVAELGSAETYAEGRRLIVEVGVEVEVEVES